VFLYIIMDNMRTFLPWTFVKRNFMANNSHHIYIYIYIYIYMMWNIYIYIYIYIYDGNYLPWNFFWRKFMEGRFSFFVKINSRILVFVFQGIGYKPSPFEVTAISPRFIPKYIFKHFMERSLDYFCRIICNLTLVKLFIFNLLIN